MDPVISDWIGLLIRWAHVMTGIAWIGTSFFFIFLDASLRKRAHTQEGVAGESWMVHGGGFYLMEKYLVAPPSPCPSRAALVQVRGLLHLDHRHAAAWP